jgi:hypothetical protein
MHGIESPHSEFRILIENNIAGLQEDLVSLEAPTDPKPHSGEERRRSRRVVLTVPVALNWMTVRGEAMNALATAHHVSMHGASLHFANFKFAPALNGEITLKSSLSDEVCQARVTRVRRLASGKVDSIGVELLAPSLTFWGLTFQLQETTAQLLAIESAFQARTQDVDFRVLRSLAEAVKDLSAVASVIHEWQELKTTSKNAYSVLEPLSNIRVRRAIQLFRDLTSDIDASELTSYNEEFVELAKAVERLNDRMTRGSFAYNKIK